MGNTVTPVLTVELSWLAYPGCAAQVQYSRVHQRYLFGELHSKQGGLHYQVRRTVLTEGVRESIACLLLCEEYVWVSLGNAMKAKQSKDRESYYCRCMCCAASASFIAWPLREYWAYYWRTGVASVHCAVQGRAPRRRGASSSHRCRHHNCPGRLPIG